MHSRRDILLGFIMLTTFLLVLAPAQDRSAVVAPRQVFVVNTQDASIGILGTIVFAATVEERYAS